MTGKSPLLGLMSEVGMAAQYIDTIEGTSNRYKTKALCPVCSEVMGEAVHNVPTIPAHPAALLFGDYRREHGRKHPDCTAHINWFLGWELETGRDDEE